MNNHAAATAAKSLQSCPTLQPHRQQPTRLPHPWHSPGNNTRHILIKLTKTKVGEKILKVKKKKQQVTSKRISIGLTEDLSEESL